MRIYGDADRRLFALQRADADHALSRQGRLFGVPIPVFIWAAVGVAVTFLLRRTPMGRYVYAIGNCQAAVFLSGVNDRLVLVASFAFAACSPRWQDCSSPAIPQRPFRRWATAISCLRSRRWSSAAPHSRRLGSVFRHGGRHDPHRAVAERSFGDADARGRAADHLRRRHHRHAARLWPQRCIGGA